MNGRLFRDGLIGTFGEHAGLRRPLGRPAKPAVDVQHPLAVADLRLHAGARTSRGRLAVGRRRFRRPIGYDHHMPAVAEVLHRLPATDPYHGSQDHSASHDQGEAQARRPALALAPAGVRRLYPGTGPQRRLQVLVVGGRRVPLEHLAECVVGRLRLGLRGAGRRVAALRAAAQWVVCLTWVHHSTSTSGRSASRALCRWLLTALSEICMVRAISLVERSAW